MSFLHLLLSSLCCNWGGSLSYPSTYPHCGTPTSPISLSHTHTHNHNHVSQHLKDVGRGYITHYVVTLIKIMYSVNSSVAPSG